MRKILVVLAIIASSPITASDLIVKAEHHYVSRSDGTPMAAVFIDEHIIVKVKLDVYTVPEMPSTKRYYDELQQLRPESWVGALTWSLVDSRGSSIALQHPVVLRTSVRNRGPRAEVAKDRDTTVDCTTYEGRLDFGFLAPGDYTLTARVHGLTKSFAFSVRTGQENDVRETFLEVKARRAPTYAEFRALQLERYRVNPSRLDAVFAVIDRALIQSTLEDTQELFALALKGMHQSRQAAKKSEQVEFFEKRIHELRETERALPEYFARRSEWKMVRDFARGNFIVKDRKSDKVVRDFGRKVDR